jgi:hypothetical protein
MYGVPQAGLTAHAVAGQLEQGVRHHWRSTACFAFWLTNSRACLSRSCELGWNSTAAGPGENAASRAASCVALGRLMPQWYTLLGLVLRVFFDL